MTITGDSSLDLGSGAFTIEAWVYRDEDAGNTGYICGNSQADGANASAGVPALYIDTNNKPHAIIFATNGASYFELISSTAINDNEWNHVALVRNSNTFSLYLNGTSVASNTTAHTMADSSNKMGVGVLGEYTANHFKGWISNFRLVNGTAVYTSNFTPSTSPLTAITNTKLLCCQDSTVTTENSGTSKTLTVTAANTYSQQMSPFTYDWYQDQSGQTSCTPVEAGYENSGASDTSDLGLIFQRGGVNNQALVWDESDDQFAFIETTSNQSTTGVVNVSAYSPVKALTYITPSSRRLKENIVNTDNAINSKLKG